MFTAITERFLEHANSSPNLDPQEAARALRHLEQLLGRPEEEGTSIRTTITEALDTATRRTAARWGDKLTAVALGGIEQSGIRLAGAEVVLRHIQAALEQVVSGQEALAHDYAKLAGGAYVQLHSQLDHLQVNVPGGRLRPPTAAEFVDLLHQYAKNRYHSLVLRRAVQVCQGLLARVPDFSREITTIRSRLGELLESLRTPSTTRVPEVDLGPGRTLLPGGQQDPDQLINQSLDSLATKDLQEVEQRLQEAVQPQFKSLAQACLSSGSPFKEFEALLRQQAEKFVETRLRLNDAAAMYLEQPLSSQEMKADLADAFHLAAPALAAARAASSAEICLVSLPTGEAGERLARLVSEALPDVNVTPVASVDDLVIYREQPQLPLSSLPQLGLVAHDAYRRLLQAHGSPHNRIDVLNWLPVG